MIVELGQSEVNLNVTRQANGPLIRKLTVSNFRNYSNASLEPSKQLVVLLGNNGAGKTNLLEAISLLSPGRGLRRAQLTQLNRVKTDSTKENDTIEAQHQWAVSVRVESNGIQTKITRELNMYQPQKQRQQREREKGGAREIEQVGHPVSRLSGPVGRLWSDWAAQSAD